MAHTKSAGSTSSSRDSQPKYLGVKIFDGGIAKIGNVIVRQKGSRMIAGTGVRLGHDFTLFAMQDGIVKFSTKRKIRFNGEKVMKKVVSVVSTK